MYHEPGGEDGGWAWAAAPTAAPSVPPEEEPRPAEGWTRTRLSEEDRAWAGRNLLPYETLSGTRTGHLPRANTGSCDRAKVRMEILFFVDREEVVFESSDLCEEFFFVRKEQIRGSEPGDDEVLNKFLDEC